MSRMMRKEVEEGGKIGTEGGREDRDMRRERCRTEVQTGTFTVESRSSSRRAGAGQGLKAYRSGDFPAEQAAPVMERAERRAQPLFSSVNGTATIGPVGVADVADEAEDVAGIAGPHHARVRARLRLPVSSRRDEQQLAFIHAPRLVAPRAKNETQGTMNVLMTQAQLLGRDGEGEIHKEDDLAANGNAGTRGSFMGLKPRPLRRPMRGMILRQAREVFMLRAPPERPADEPQGDRPPSR